LTLELIESVTHTVKHVSKPRAPVERRALRTSVPRGLPSRATRLGRLREHVRRGDEAWTLGVILACIVVFVTIVVSIVLTIVELVTLLA
jgi:hypothetical protein